MRLQFRSYRAKVFRAMLKGISLYAPKRHYPRHTPFTRKLAGMQGKLDIMIRVISKPIIDVLKELEVSLSQIAQAVNHIGYPAKKVRTPMQEHHRTIYAHKKAERRLKQLNKLAANTPYGSIVDLGMIHDNFNAALSSMLQWQEDKKY